MSKKTVVFDFDGVIHSYTSGWKGADVIPDPVVEGIQSTINSLRKEYYEVIVVSTRCAYPEGMSAVKKYLADNHIVVDAVMKEKPPAICYIDDRAICFDGHPETLLEKVRNFTPWNKALSINSNNREIKIEKVRKIKREILFRGKRTDNREWVEGYYTQLPKISLEAGGELCAEDVADYIIVNKSKQHSNFSNAYPLEIVERKQYEVDPETIGQCTGFTDKNSRKIFEGDIIKWAGAIGAVKWYQGNYTGWYVDEIYMGEQQFTNEMWNECEIIGNIFDNPELIEK